jgi:sugar O-acyltransferase (sialic acid O-acetyltransferase NeuD family)
MINIYGKGGHAKVVKSIIDAWHTPVFFNDDDYDDSATGLWVIGIGNNQSRKRIAEEVLKNKEFISVIAPSSSCDDSIVMGEGCHVMAGAVIQIDTVIGDHCIINTAASVDHDCDIGSYVHIAPNVTLCGGVEIGECSFIGAGSVVLPYIKIGKACIIGAGSVVTKDIPDSSLVYGNPAKIK